MAANLRRHRLRAGRPGCAGERALGDAVALHAGRPRRLKGDLIYKLDGDIRGRVAQIDTQHCPLFLLSGEYDYSCTPEETLAVANSIAGCEVTIMKGLGHFPMSEDPQAFLAHLLPVLEKIGRN